MSGSVPGGRAAIGALPIMGGFDQRTSGPGVPGTPRTVVKGLAFWSRVRVQRRKRSKAGPPRDQ